MKFLTHLKFFKWWLWFIIIFIAPSLAELLNYFFHNHPLDSKSWSIGFIVAAVIAGWALSHIAVETSRRVETEEQLKNNERKLITILASIGDAVIVTDPKGLIIFMNRTAEYLTQWKRQDAFNKHADLIFDVFPTESLIKKVLQENKIIQLPEKSFLKRKKDSSIQIAANAAPISNGDAQIQGVILTFRR